jgi:large subunit ribosomal protein L5
MPEQPRLKEQYHQEIRPRVQEELGISNPMAVPRLQKIIVNMGVGEGSRDIKLLDAAEAELTLITGQKPLRTKARISVAAFKIREGMPVGCKVTLRGDRMWEFFDRLVNITLPRVRDFRGLPEKGFDGMGNYTLGLKDQLVFPEIDYTKVDHIRGMNITLVTSATNDADARKMLEEMKFPFARS